jgi:hypothetical protein
VGGGLVAINLVWFSHNIINNQTMIIFIVANLLLIIVAFLISYFIDKELEYRVRA